MKTSLLLTIIVIFLLVTRVCFAQWVKVGLNDEVIKEIAAQDQNIFAVTADSALYRSTDSGNNWAQIVDSSAIDVAISLNSKLFLLKANYPMLRQVLSSTDLGDSWDIIISEGWLGIPNSTSITVSPIGYIFFVHTFRHRDKYVGGIMVSTDEGITWSAPIGGLPAGHSFSFRDQNVLNGGRSTIKHSLKISDNNGLIWSDIVTPHSEKRVTNLCMNGNIICGGENPDWPDDDGIFLTSDMCNTWTRISILIPVTGLTLPQGGLLVGTDQLGTFLFSDNGDSLGSRNEGLTNLNIHTLTLDNNDYVYAGTGNGVWRRPLSEIVTSVENEPTQPTEFFLEHNFPNPFNPNTKIRYSIPQASKVVIKVFDILANEIEMLVNEEKPVGTYELTWNAANLPSGVYFYRIQAGEFVETKKMIFLK